jgi:hypothetical protein
MHSQMIAYCSITQVGSHRAKTFEHVLTSGAGHEGYNTGLSYDKSSCNRAIFPKDFRQVGHITAQEMQRILWESLPISVRLTVIIDSKTLKGWEKRHLFHLTPGAIAVESNYTGGKRTMSHRR